MTEKIDRFTNLEHLTEEERKTVLSIFPKEIADIEANASEDTKNIPEVEKEKGLEKKSVEQKEDWKDGYLEYEKKTNVSDHVSYEDGEIEISEEEFE